MVETRGQKRKLEEDDSSLVVNDTNINCKIKKKKTLKPCQEESENAEEYPEEYEEESAIMTNDNTSTTTTEPDFSEQSNKLDEDEDEDEDFDAEDELDKNILNMKFDSKQTQEIIKDSIKTLIKRYGREGKEFLKTKGETDYDKFDELIDSIYGGEFFERVPLEDRKKKLKDTLTQDEIKELTDEL
jgi:hypothetical protein